MMAHFLGKGCTEVYKRSTIPERFIRFTSLSFSFIASKQVLLLLSLLRPVHLWYQVRQLLSDQYSMLRSPAAMRCCGSKSKCLAEKKC
uniref:Uncharacterized protein n=1 Tax=Sphaerodactylus townsendi TaxID=933632 RepID=A0ACB8G696_9SAUR